MFKPDQKLTQAQFFQLATWFEGSLILVAYVIGWAADMNPWADLHFDATTLIYGVIGTVPLYMLFVVTFRSLNEELKTIRQFLIQQMGPTLAASRPYQLAYLALLAGVTEEALFRGILQPLIENHWGWLAGLMLSNAFFAMAHAITRLYAILAGLTGIYLGLSLDIAGYRNLGIPIAIHALYDFLAFIAVARAYQMRHSREF
jgi:membrane protease YdiL (CAAX protease family)